MKKKILYIGTPIFNYHKKIILELESQGYSVDYYNDRPSDSSFIKGMIKVRESWMRVVIQRYFNKILTETKDKNYDLVFIVNCKVFTPVMIEHLRDVHKSARFRLYMWDSLKLYPNSKKLIPIFDIAYSFDSEDCSRVDKLNFLPLFYTKDYERIGQDSVMESEYDIVSICTAHPNRYKIIHQLFPELKQRGIKIFSYMFLNKLQYIYNKMFIQEFKNARNCEFEFTPLSEDESLAIIRKANTIFDIQHNRQSGLTMRTIETLGAKRKLITTNTNIKKYDFYNENNIFVLEEYNLDRIVDFIKNRYNPVSEDIYRKYSLHSWVKTIINEDVNSYNR
mgnify:CR=1 FL=1